MSTAMNDGGPAFPRAAQFDGNYQHDTANEPGMSLRDYIATHALVAGLQAEPGVVTGEDQGTRRAALAIAAYEIADAMLAARQLGAPGLGDSSVQVANGVGPTVRLGEF